MLVNMSYLIKSNKEPIIAQKIFFFWFFFMTITLMKRKLPVFYRVIIYLFISLAIYFDEIYIDFFRKGSKVMTATR